MIAKVEPTTQVAEMPEKSGPLYPDYLRMSLLRLPRVYTIDYNGPETNITQQHTMIPLRRSSLSAHLSMMTPVTERIRQCLT